MCVCVHVSPRWFALGKQTEFRQSAAPPDESLCLQLPGCLAPVVCVRGGCVCVCVCVCVGGGVRGEE